MSCAIRHFVIRSRDHTPTIIFRLLLLFYPRHLAQVRVFLTCLDKFPTGSFLSSTDMCLGISSEQNCRMCKPFLKFFDQKYLSKRVSSETVLILSRHHSLHNFQTVIIR